MQEKDAHGHQLITYPVILKEENYGQQMAWTLKAPCLAKESAMLSQSSLTENMRK